MNSEKSEELRIEAGYCLLEFLKEIDTPFISPHYDSLV
jgi:hypothetical protein